MDVNRSPPRQDTFVEFTTGSLGDVDRALLLQLQDQMQQMGEQLKKMDERMKQQQGQISKLKKYRALGTTPEQVASSLLNQFSKELDRCTHIRIEATGKLVSQKIKTSYQAHTFNLTPARELKRKEEDHWVQEKDDEKAQADHHTFVTQTSGVRGYKNLIRKADNSKSKKIRKMFFELLERVEKMFTGQLKAKGVELSTGDLRDAMRKYYRLDGLKLVRDRGAHLFDMDGEQPELQSEERKQDKLFAIGDIREAIKDGSFLYPDLLAPSVSEALRAACEIHEKTLV